MRGPVYRSPRSHRAVGTVVVVERPVFVEVVVTVSVAVIVVVLVAVVTDIVVVNVVVWVVAVVSTQLPHSTRQVARSVDPVTGWSHSRSSVGQSNRSATPLQSPVVVVVVAVVAVTVVHELQSTGHFSISSAPMSSSPH